MKPVRLRAPSQDGGVSEFSSRSLKQIAHWLEGLPLANAQSSARSLTIALARINRSPLEKAHRFEVMELFRPRVYDICAALAARDRNAALPLNATARAQTQAVRGLLSELADGFKAVVNAELERWQRGGGERTALLLQLATQRALLALGRVLLETYRVYESEPPGLWQDLHALQYNAELYNLQSLPVEGTADSDETALSIKQAYLRAAVLALSNPYHLMQGEAEELYQRIGRWVHFVRIARPGDTLSGRFVIDMGSDFPPRYHPCGVRLPPPRLPRVLDFEALVDTVGQQIERRNQAMARSGHAATLSERLQRDMYVRFRDALGGRQERRSQRRATVARLSLVEGLGGVHFFLSGQRPFQPAAQEAELDLRLTAASAHTPHSPALRLRDEPPAREPAPLATATAKFKAYDRDLDDVWRKANLIVEGDAGEQEPHGGYRISGWHRKNESSGGMALFCPPGAPIQLRVGELLAYTEAEAAAVDDWRLASIRWLRSRPDGGLELGIKQLGESGYPLSTKGVSGAGRGAQHLRGILLPGTTPPPAGSTLITPAAVYDIGSVLRLTLEDRFLYARLTELVETTRQFAHYRFRLVEAPLAERARQRR